MDTRTVRLRAVEAASKLHRELGLKNQIREGLRPIDVYDAITRIGIPLLFRPLQGLLGAYLSAPAPGIMISSADSLSPARQRYTAAHELGHCYMGHESSIDSEETLKRTAASIATAPVYEAEAEVFASEFLMPKALVVKTAKRSGWGAKDVRDPRVVYQISLRLGTSYSATAYALRSHELITSRDLDLLVNVRPKKIKEELLTGEITLESYHSDVVVLSEQDHGRLLILKPGDCVILNLAEHTSGGFQWRLREAYPNLDMLRDNRTQEGEGLAFGQPTKRIFTFKGQDLIELGLVEDRAWESHVGSEFLLLADFRGREEGLPRYLGGGFRD